MLRQEQTDSGRLVVGQFPVTPFTRSYQALDTGIVRMHVPMSHSKRMDKLSKTIALMCWVGLFCAEISLIGWFYLTPQFEARNAPGGQWEMETPLHGSFGMWIALIGSFAIVILGNALLVRKIWRGFKQLRGNE